jgi:hypothetical protein
MGNLKKAQGLRRMAHEYRAEGRLVKAKRTANEMIAHS